MPVDRKADYAGNHRGAYVDQEGMSRQFTYVDHDPKIKMAIPISKEEAEKAKDEVKNFRQSLVDKIINLPGHLCPEPYVDFTLRGAERDSIGWNEIMLRDEGLPLQNIIDLYTITNNRVKLKGLL